MDSYGIHEAQLQGNAATLTNDKYNTDVRNHNQAALQQYKSKMAGVKGAGDQMKEMDGGLTAWHTLSGVHNAIQGYNQYKMYGGFKNAITTGAQHNLYQVSGGRMGSAPMGPTEKGVRAQTEGSVSSKPKVDYSGEVDSDLQADKNVSGMVRDPTRPNVFKQPVEQLSEGVSGPSTAQQTMEGGADRGTKVAAAQSMDRAAGYTGPQTDASKTTGQLATEAKATPLAKSSAGLSLEGESLKGMMKTVGGAKGEAIGHAVGMAIGPVSGLVQIGENTADIAENWGKDSTAKKVSDIAGDIGGALDVASAVAPVLAPVAAAADLISGVADLVSGISKEHASLKSSTSSYQSSVLAGKGSAAPIQSGSTTTAMAKSSIQKVSSAGSSSY